MTAAAVTVVALLVSSLAAQQASPASSATADRNRTESPAAPRSQAVGDSPAGQPSTGHSPAGQPSAGQPSTGQPPTPEATSSVLTSTPAVSLSPLAAIGRISQTIRVDVAAGQMRQDVGVDLNNLIQPVRTQLAAGERAPVAQLADALRAKLRTRLSEGAVTAAAVRALNGEFDALRRSADGSG